MTFKYSKKGRQVSALPTESVQDSLACDPNIGATHVVTEIKYGFNAFLLFEILKSKRESKQDIGGHLSIMIKKLGPLSVEGSAKIKLTAEEKKIGNALRFKFHGDTVIDPPPQTFDDAIEVYKSLPGRSKENERVVSFSIAPLSEYCGLAGKICYDYMFIRLSNSKPL